MRVDVNPVPAERELDALDARLRAAGDGFGALAAVPTHVPSLVARWREADGEHYAYVEDVPGRRLAGYTVFNRLVEVGRRLDPVVRSPHSKYRAAYQRLGLASAVYRQALDAGLCLVSGARQSEGASALWRALAARYELGYVELRDKAVAYLGRSIDPRVRDDLHTRMVLFGCGWDPERLIERATGPRRAPLSAARSLPFTPSTNDKEAPK